MAVKFNPFTGQLQIDEKGSGGGSSYIDGEVQNFSALPETLGSPAVDSAYLVREAEGTWLLNRKPAGIYIRTANTGTRASDWTYAGEFPDVFNDANFVLYDNGDSTKNLQFQLSGIDTATTRTLTAPNASGTIARTEDFAAPPAIGNTTPNSGAFTTLSANNGTLTASAPVLDLAQTWDASGVSFVGLRFDVTNTASATGSRVLRFTVGGTSNLLGIYRDSAGFAATPRFEIGSAGVTWNIRTRTGGGVGCNFDSIVGLGSSLQFGVGTTTSSGDVILERDAADTLAQRRATNPQTFRLYNTFTDASNYERGFMRWSSNVFQIGTEAAGTGTNRNLEFHAGGTVRFTVNAAGGVTLAGGAAFAWGGGATRIIGATFPSGLLQLQTGSTDRLTIDANGIIGFGGTTSSFPALKRSSTTLQVRLANDSDFTAIQGKLTTETAYTAGAPTATGYLVLYDSNGTAYKVPAEAL